MTIVKNMEQMTEEHEDYDEYGNMEAKQNLPSMKNIVNKDESEEYVD